ncbi:EpsG family protein [Lactobacillus amylovorus]|uniref:EpsG family protein n=1 Tax=Lactobacillus amylovorus TaxID=1604 RepID=UPI003F8C2365
MNSINEWSIFFYCSVIIFSTITLGYVSKISDKKRRYIAYIILTIITSLVAGFRDITGTDSAMYKYMFITNDYHLNINGQIGRAVSIEKGYIFINSLARKIMPYFMFLFCISFVTIYLLILCIDRYRNDINVYIAALVLYTTIYLTSFNIMRQGLAISIGLFGFFEYLSNKKIKALIFIILATLFHTSAIVLLPLFGIKKITNNRRSKIYMIIILITFLILVRERTFLGYLAKFITSSDYYAGYFIRDAATGSGLLRYLIRVSPILIIALLYLFNFKGNNDFKSIIFLMILGYILSGIGSETDTQVGRIGLYFQTLDIYASGYMANTNLKIGKIIIDKKIISLLISLYFIIWFVYSIIISNNGQIIPYIPFQNWR